MRRQGPPSAPRISRNFFIRTSGKVVDRCNSQSSIVGYSPGKAARLPATPMNVSCDDIHSYTYWLKQRHTTGFSSKDSHLA